jgi:hypothetical protein
VNIETREIRDERDLTPNEKASGQWIPVRRKYVQKQPVSDADYQRILAAEAKRLRRRARNLDTLARLTPEPAHAVR